VLRALSYPKFKRSAGEQRKIPTGRIRLANPRVWAMLGVPTMVRKQNTTGKRSIARTMSAEPGSVLVSLPDWCRDIAAAGETFATDERRMGLAIRLARENVLRNCGGPFGAAIFEQDSGRLVAVGVNSVERLHNSVLHAETVAIMFAQARCGCYTLNSPGMSAHELHTSCEPCAMCLGALLWAGIRRVVCGASRDDAARIGFEEGPVFPASHDYLRSRGVEIVGGVLAGQAREVLDLYARRGGLVYNG
jgi:tRNA(Arg) A34 adenosine deaminase TadA